MAKLIWNIKLLKIIEKQMNEWKLKEQECSRFLDMNFKMLKKLMNFKLICLKKKLRN